MKEVICNLMFTTTSTAKKEGLTFSNKIEYIGREEATDKNKNFAYNIREDAHANFDKYNLEQDEIKYFRNGKAVRKNEIEIRKNTTKEIDEIQEKKNSCLYSGIISFDEDMEKLIREKNMPLEEFHELYINPHLEKFYQRNGFMSNNLLSYVSYHTNTDHLHFHFEFLEINPTKSLNELEEKNFSLLKENIYFNLNEDKKELKNISVKKFEVAKKKLIDNLKELDPIDFNFKKKEKYITAFEKYKEVPVRKLGDYKSKTIQNIMLDVADDFLNDNEQINRRYKDMINEAKKVDDMNGSKVFSKGKEMEIKKRIVNNFILPEMKADRLEEEDLEKVFEDKGMNNKKYANKNKFADKEKRNFKEETIDDEFFSQGNKGKNYGTEENDYQKDFKRYKPKKQGKKFRNKNKSNNFKNYTLTKDLFILIHKAKMESKRKLYEGEDVLDKAAGIDLEMIN